MSPGNRLSLPSVTLCAASSVNLEATVKAMHRCLDVADFAEALLLTDDGRLDGKQEVAVRNIPQMTSSRDYSLFILEDLLRHITTDYVLIIQWDGFIIDHRAWSDEFLQYDYIGAPWPHFADGQDVGNGGFSLRSRRLLEACRDPSFQIADPEDVAICRINRRLLEDRHGIRFAPRAIAERFSFEREKPGGPTFGFHGIFNMIDAIGEEAFWSVYSSLDERSAARQNFATLMRQLSKRGISKRQAKVFYDRIRRRQVTA